MAGSIKGIIVEIGGDTSGLQKALSKVNSATSSLSRELRGINSLLKLDPKNTELLSQKQKVLNEEISTTEEKLKSLRKLQEEADKTIAAGGEISQENYRALQREIIATEQRLRQLNLENSKWITAGRSIEEFGTKVTNISNKIDKMGTTLTTRLTLPIAALAATIVNTSASFESSMKQVAATMGITAKEIEGGSESYQILEEAALKCGETTKYSASEAADALNYLALAGYDAKKSAEVLPKVLNLAAAGDLELATASDMVTDAMAALNLETKDLDRYINEMAKTSQKSNTSVAQLGEGTLTVAGTAKLANMSLETMNAELGVLANNGIKGAEGGTHLRNIILSLTSPTDVATKALKNLGINVSDNKGNIRDLNDIMSDFNKKLNDLSDEKKTNIISEIFNKTDISAVNALIKGSGKEFSDLKKQISNCDNAAQDMADTMNSSLKGQATLLKSQIESIAITTGKKLMPVAKKMVEQISNLATGFSKLTDEQVETIVKTAALVATIGPAVKIMGTLGKTIGTGIKTVGSFSQAVGFMGKTSTEAFKNASTRTQTLTKALTALTSPAGLATLGIAGVSAAVIYFATKETEAQKKAREFAEEMANSKQALEEYNKSIDETTNANLSHIDSVSRLKDELVTLVDENGKVKKGYESRVSFILNELNEALGTEYNLNGDIIDNYKKLQDEIDTTIEKKKAEIQLNAEEEKYKNAIENQKEAVESLKTAQENLGMSIDEARSKYAELRDIVTNPNRNKDKLYTGIGKDINELKNLISAYEDAEWQVKEYTNNVKDYEEDYAKFTEGKYSEIGNTIKASTEDWAAKTLEEINKSIGEQGNAMQQYKKIYEDTGNQVALQLSQQAQQNLDNLTQELVKKTQTLNELGPQEIEAWKNIATQSYSSYSEEIAKMAPEMQQKIQDVTGVIAGGTPQMQEKAEELGRKMVEEFDKSADAKQKALNTITGYLKGLSDADKRELLKQAGIENADIVIDELNKGNLSEENGKNILKGLWAGLKNNTWQGKILGVASGLAQAVNKAFTGKDGWDEHSPSKKMKKFAEYYIQPISDVMEKRKNSIVASASRLADKVNSTMTNKLNIPLNDYKELQGNLNSKIVDSTKTVFTTPQIVFNVQELDEAKLQQCFNYINRKFGSAY